MPSISIQGTSHPANGFGPASTMRLRALDSNDPVHQAGSSTCQPQPHPRNLRDPRKSRSQGLPIDERNNSDRTAHRRTGFQPVHHKSSTPYPCPSLPPIPPTTTSLQPPLCNLSLCSLSLCSLFSCSLFSVPSVISVFHPEEVPCTPENTRTSHPSSQQRLQHLPRHIGQAEISSVVPIRQSLMIQSQQMQDRGMQIVQMHSIHRSLVSHLI